MLDYYETNYQLYHEKTFFIDPSSFLKPFIDRLSPGAKIMDIGCSSGRDLLWLKQLGFDVIGFERSGGLAQLARGITGCEIIQGDFEFFDFSLFLMDAILLIGALVHIPHTKMPYIFTKVTKAIRPHGYVLISLKEGVGTLSDLQRVFYLWQDKALRSIFQDCSFEIINFYRNKSQIRNDDLWLTYILKRNF